MRDKLARPASSTYLESIRKNDREGLNQVYRTFFPGIRRFVIQNSGRESEAHDVFQEGLIILFRKAKDPAFEITQSFEGYLFAVCKQIWRNELRRKGRSEVSLEEAESLFVGEEILDLMEQREKDSLYRKCFAKLGKDCKKILQLFFEGTSMRRIVEQMGLSSVAYAKKRKFQCKEKLLGLIQTDPIYTELKAN